VEQKILEKLDGPGRESADRRGFLKKAGQVAATVPAVALLLSAQATPAEAFGRYGRKRRKGHGHGKAKSKGKAKSNRRPSLKHGFKSSSSGTSALRGPSPRRSRRS